MLRFSTTSHSTTNEKYNNINNNNNSNKKTNDINIFDFEKKKARSNEKVQTFVDNVHETFRDTCSGEREGKERSVTTKSLTNETNENRR